MSNQVAPNYVEPKYTVSFNSRDAFTMTAPYFTKAASLVVGNPIFLDRINNRNAPSEIINGLYVYDFSTFQCEGTKPYWSFSSSGPIVDPGFAGQGLRMLSLQENLVRFDVQLNVQTPTITDLYYAVLSIRVYEPNSVVYKDFSSRFTERNISSATIDPEWQALGCDTIIRLVPGNIVEFNLKCNQVINYGAYGASQSVIQVYRLN